MDYPSHYDRDRRRVLAHRYLSSMLYGITASDPVTFAMMPLVLALIAIIASVIPALRALRIDPNIALREE